MSGSRGCYSTPLRRDWWIYAALFLAIVAAYAQVYDFQFVNYDDPDYVTENLHVRGGLTASGVDWAFKSTEYANWLPLTWLSHMLDVELYGLDSGRHHLTNVAIHAITTLLLFALLRKITGDRWPSAFVAFIFGLHPLHVESVAWIAERKDVLSGLFYILALWAYVLYVERPGAHALCGNPDPVRLRNHGETNDRDVAIRSPVAGRVASAPFFKEGSGRKDPSFRALGSLRRRSPTSSSNAEEPSTR